jgi:D-glucosaminate-6-phosphate ammonia-lyase
MNRESGGAGMNDNSTFSVFGVRPVINCCGIYTDLGGSVLSDSVWHGIDELNGSYVRMTELLSSAGRMIASLVGAEGARVTPGASAAIALSVAAVMTGHNGKHWEQLPDTHGLKNEVVMATSHNRRYKYASCVRMPGARLIEAGPEDHFDIAAIAHALTTRTACVFIPAHLLDGFAGVTQLTALIDCLRPLGVPVIVDAAYLSYPIELMRAFAEAGADLTCFSAKYFFGPNSGGFVAGKTELIEIVTGLDFTRFESGEFRTFGRPFKMSRYDVAATALALREWCALDHPRRWRQYADRIALIASALPPRTGIRIEPQLFTLSEELVEGPDVNCLALRFDKNSGLSAQAIANTLEAGDPIIATVVHGEALVIAVDTLLDGQTEFVAQQLRLAMQ